MKVITLSVMYVATALIGFIVLGCGDGSEASPEYELCQDLDGLHSAIDDIGEPPADGVSADSIRESRDEISHAFESVEESALEVADVRTQDLRAAWDALRAALQPAEGEDARTVVVNSGDEFGAFVDELISLETNVTCDDGGQ